ncbi:MAG: hypothetical protein HKP58_20370 [Desulfatitalea sp.]|nr:hypothetical protein [Desulfatitalea sp.]NNK02774.1 hypothetical protein [Desulfatitalea sp.]
MSHSKSNATKGSSSQTRMRIVKTPEDVEALSHLNDEEKVMARENLGKIPGGEGWNLLGNDPKLQGVLHMFELTVQELLKPDLQFVPFGPMNMACIEVARHMKCEWQAGALSVCTASAIGTPISKEDCFHSQMGVLDFPDSKLWTDEQRMTIKFIRACLNNKMTDELYSQAHATWGQKKLLRIIAWIGFCHMWAMFINAAKVSWPKMHVAPMPNASLMDAYHSHTAKVWQDLQEVWASVTPFLKVLKQSTSELSVQPEGVRFPIIRSAADIETLAHLSEEEKALARENLDKIPGGEGWFLLGSDPELQGFLHIVELSIALLLAPDSQFVPFGGMNVGCIEVARQMGCEWQAGVLNVITASAIGTWVSDENCYHSQLGMLDFPDSALWTDEQRVTIKFIRACLENTMTDELFDQARKTWGEQKLLRHIAWVGFAHMWAMIINTANVGWHKVHQLPIPDESLKQGYESHIAKIFEDLQGVWAAVTPFFKK